MKRVLVLLAACSSPAAPPVAKPTPAPKPTKPARCLTWSEYDAKEKELTAADEAQYQAGLRAQKLALVTLPLESWQVEAMGAPPAQRETTRNGKHLLLAGIVGVSCGSRGVSPFILAQSGDQIFIVTKRFDNHRLDIPVCPVDCSPHDVQRGPGCGAAPAPMMFAYELPPGTSYGGDRTIDIVSYWPSPDLTGTLNCPPAPPPPPPPP